MNKFKIILGAAALAVASVAIVACNKEKTAQQEMSFEQQPKNPNDYTLAEMAEAMSWEEGKAFFENQPIKDYTSVCEKVLNDCGDEERTTPWINFIFEWHWAPNTNNCISDYFGVCLIIRHGYSPECNAMGYIEDGKLVIVPTGEENGFTADGYFAVGSPIEVQNDTIIVREGIYTAYYDEELGKYVSVAVDIDSSNQP